MLIEQRWTSCIGRGRRGLTFRESNTRAPKVGAHTTDYSRTCQVFSRHLRVNDGHRICLEACPKSRKPRILHTKATRRGGAHQRNTSWRAFAGMVMTYRSEACPCHNVQTGRFREPVSCFPTSNKSHSDDACWMAPECRFGTSYEATG